MRLKLHGGCLEKESVDFLKRLSIVSQIAGGIPQLATAAGVSVSAVRKYLAGSEPTRPVIIAMSNATGVKAGWLLDGSGLVCEPDSLLMQRARQLIASEFNLILMIPDYLENGKVGAAKLFEDEYRAGYSRCERPEWLRLVIPEFSFDEVISWRMGQLDYVSEQSSVADGIISKPADEIAFVSSAIRTAYGVRIDGLSLGMEAAIFKRACDLGGRVKLTGMPSDMLSKFIQTFAYEFDPKAQGSVG